ncbi:MAG: lipid-binding SYLF domain-containing protein [Acidobacteriales bacterium]|nr:lipid-binding SYLF domain-containing protein [Terriglobales bacterium]
MKKFLLPLFLAALAIPGWAASDKADATERLQAAGKVLTEIMEAPDKGIPEEVVDGSKCIAVVPNLVKGGFIFGAKHGKGVATCRTANGWSAPSFFTVSGGSWGAQIGAQGVDLVLMIMNKQGMDNLLSNKFEVGGEASAAGGPVGRHASAGTDWKAETQILSYSRAKGLFAGITLEGSVIRPDKDSTVAIYGENASHQSILSGKVQPTPEAKAFLNSVRMARTQARTQERREGDKR